MNLAHRYMVTLMLIRHDVQPELETNMDGIVVEAHLTSRLGPCRLAVHPQLVHTAKPLRRHKLTGMCPSSCL